ncbi:MAG TPA: trehalase-like domain-containing protein, partial [Chthoniobacteraceae bacterium]|nr:trehalase-like domain-containing protein [Chthoniobacteraceae bacterium]
MNAPPPAFTPFAPIERHGVIGDRRTGALVAADGTIDWFCAPDFDCAPVLGALLDPERGGFFRVGTKSARFGQQRYVENTAILITTWPEEGIELADVMAWPDDDRAKKLRDQRIILRRLRATSDATVLLELRPRRNFKEPPSLPRNAVFHFDDGVLGMWASFPVHTGGGEVHAEIHMRPRDEHWIALGWNLSPDDWSVKHAAEVFASTKKYWEDWCGELKIENGGERTGALKRSALTLQLLSGAPHDSALAALTTSLPERIGGDRNYDYRCAWVRDASLSLAMLARMGKTDAVQR